MSHTITAISASFIPLMLMRENIKHPEVHCQDNNRKLRKESLPRNPPPEWHQKCFRPHPPQQVSAACLQPAKRRFKKAGRSTESTETVAKAYFNPNKCSKQQLRAREKARCIQRSAARDRKYPPMENEDTAVDPIVSKPSPAPKTISCTSSRQSEELSLDIGEIGSQYGYILDSPARSDSSEYSFDYLSSSEYSESGSEWEKM